ncbi:MAG: P22 phage major capsid protein family protein [Armatimonadota bacterium]
MANTLYTSSILARVALSLLRSTLKMGALVYKDYSKEFKKVGQSITIRKPPAFSVQDLTTEAAGAGITTQNVTETTTTLTLDRWRGVRFAVSTADKALKLEEIRDRIIRPAILPLAEDLDAYLLGLYTQIPYWYGTAGTTPNGLDDLGGIGKVLADNKCPTDDVSLVVNPAAQAQLWPVMAAMNVAKPAPENEALTRAQIGLVNNMNTFMDQNVASHNAGGDLSVNINNGAGYAIGTTAISLKNIAAALVVGDLLTIGGYQHTIATAGALGGGIQAVTIYPALKAAVADNDAVVVAADHVANLAFHRNCIALATAPLEPPSGGATGYTLTDEEFGITVRVVTDWDNTNMSEVTTLDLLYGAKVIYPELGARLLG